MSLESQLDHNKCPWSIFNHSNLSEFQSLLHAGIDLISQKLIDKNSPFTGILPHELAERFQNLRLDTPKHNIEQVLAELESLYLNDAVYFHHPNYLAHLNPPITNVAILAELIQASLNTSMDTWDQSAGATFIEQSLINWMAERIGYSATKADGIFTSGGTQSNLMGLLLARDHYCSTQLAGHNVQLQGLPTEAKRFRIFTSEICHFSIQKSAALLGLGFDAVVPIAVDEHYRMNPKALGQAIHDCKTRGDIPLAVIATLGTTDFGSLDPIAEISMLCNMENVWLHADAAYGCGLLISPTYRSRIQDIVLADSVTVDYHKSFLQPVACGAFLAKDKSHLNYLTYHADYLNPLSQKLEGTPNLVCKSLQTTRRFDALKLWLTLRLLGPDNLGKAFDTVIDLAARVYHRNCQDPQFEFIHSPSLSTLVFRFIGNGDPSETILDKINIGIRKALSRNGSALIASTKVHGKLYLKFTLLNPTTSEIQIEEVLSLIKQQGNRLLSNVNHPQEQKTTLKVY